jgi:hypothetical protein
LSKDIKTKHQMVATCERRRTAPVMIPAAIPIFSKRIIKMTEGRSFSSSPLVALLALPLVEVGVLTSKGEEVATGVSFPAASHAGVSDMVLSKRRRCRLRRRAKCYQFFHCCVPLIPSRPRPLIVARRRRRAVSMFLVVAYNRPLEAA